MRKLDKVVGRAVLILAFGAFVLSFEKLHHVAVSAGVAWYLAWIYPLIVEGFTTIATLAAFLRRGQSGAWYPWCAGLLAFGYSLWANSVPDAVPHEIVRAVPVVCIPLMVHMYVIVKGHADAVQTAEVEAVAIELAAEAEAEPVTVEAVGEAKPKPARPAPVSKAVAAFLVQARNADTPAARNYWQTRAAEAALQTA